MLYIFFSIDYFLLSNEYVAKKKEFFFLDLVVLIFLICNNVPPVSSPLSFLA